MRGPGKQQIPTYVQQFGLFLDDKSVLKCKGRINNSTVSLKAKNPILLPAKHPLIIPYSRKVWRIDSFRTFGERKLGELIDQPID